jgi:peptidoglycan-associated lipoprotein
VRALTQDFQAAAGDRIFFSPASAELGSRAKAVIAAQAAWLKRNPQVPILLSAHADDVGGSDFNAELSRRRGNAVKGLFVAEGIEPGRIRVVAHGRERRIADCDSATCAAQNRRVVTVIGDSEPSLR